VTRATAQQLSLHDEALNVRSEGQDAVVIPFPTPAQFKAEQYTVGNISKTTANELVVRHHYLHRKPHNAYSFGLFGANGDVLGACIFGTPASRHLQQGMCPTDPGRVVELNRLWVHDSCPRNTESFFVARALHALPALLIVSYADTAWGTTAPSTAR
jgi:hypothetical protein